RLARHGPAPSGGALAAFLAGGAPADVPPDLARLTIRAAAACPAASPQVVALAEGVLKAMLLTRLKVASLFVLTAAVVTAGARLTGSRAFAAGPARTSPAEAREDDKPKAGGERRAADKGNEVIRGSGQEVTKELKLSGFTAVDVGGAFQVEIAR